MRKLLICGASSGIGEALFKYYQLVWGERRVAGFSRTQKPRKNAYCGNATDPKDVFAVMSEYRPDIVVNCIGQAAMNLALFSSCSQYDRVVTNNVKSTFLIGREAGRYMLQNGWGRIINFGSCTTAMEIEGESLYTASKSAVLGFSRVLAKELAPHVTVNCISPGPVDTRLLAGVKQEKIDAIVNRQIIKKMATFEDITHVVDMLINSPMITGQNIFINGAG